MTKDERIFALYAAILPRMLPELHDLRTWYGVDERIDVALSIAKSAYSAYERSTKPPPGNIINGFIPDDPGVR